MRYPELVAWLDRRANLREEGNENLIAGRWSESLGGGRFEVSEALPPSGSLGSWPTSGPADARAAIEAGEHGLPAWRELAFEERGERLRAAARILEEDAEGAQLVARRLGLRRDEMARHSTGIEAALVEALRDERPAGPGAVSLSVPSWSDLLVGTFLSAARELVRGNACVLVGDERLPIAADRVVRALLAAGVCEGAFALLHGLTRDGLQCAIDDARVHAVSASGDRELIGWLRRACQRAGVERQELDMLRCAVTQVAPDDDLGERAVELVERAFGRSSTLFGQRRGQVARVFCPERSFSSFSEVLLAALEGSEPARDPLPLIDRKALRTVRRQWAIGLGDGATLVFGGEQAGSGSGDTRVLPTVFTNVEEGMASARCQAPFPVLCLLRSGSDSPRNRAHDDAG